MGAYACAFSGVALLSDFPPDESPINCLWTHDSAYLFSGTISLLGRDANPHVEGSVRSLELTLVEGEPISIMAHRVGAHTHQDRAATLHDRANDL